MLRFRNLAQFGVMVSDLSRGSVRERAGRVEIRYDLCDEDVETFRPRDRPAGASCSGRRARKRVFLPVDGAASCGPSQRRSTPR